MEYVLEPAAPPDTRRQKKNAMVTPQKLRNKTLEKSCRQARTRNPVTPYHMPGQ